MLDNDGCCPECPHYPECLEDPSISCNSIICNDEDPCGTIVYTQKGPYMQTAWGQGIGYNDLCPNGLNCSNDSLCGISNSNVPTGCVATAMAQIIRYWAVPTTYYYDYTTMPNNSNACNGNNTHIHRLMLDAGNSVDMSWACDGSGADLDVVADVYHYGKGFKKFGYRNADYTTYGSGSENLVIANLNSGYPVMLGGYKTRTFIWPFYIHKNGHAWVCDGYYRYSNNCYNSLYFNMNWGWDGRYNGWYAYNNWENPVGNFHYKQDMVYNILP